VPAFIILGNTLEYSSDIKQQYALCWDKIMLLGHCRGSQKPHVKQFLWKGKKSQSLLANNLASGADIKWLRQHLQSYSEYAFPLKCWGTEPL